MMAILHLYRASGKGDDDIYYFEGIKPTDCLEYSGNVLNSRTNETIANAIVEVYDSKDGLILATKTDENGFYNFILPRDFN